MILKTGFSFTGAPQAKKYWHAAGEMKIVAKIRQNCGNT